MGILFFIITLLCAIPFVITLVYFFMGAKSFLIGKREGSENKILGGIKSMIYSSIGVVASIILWYWLMG